MSRHTSPIHHAAQQTRRRISRRGVVLPIAMWLLVLLLIVALGLAYDTQLSVKSVGNTQDRAEAYYAAYSGIERVCAELESGQVLYTAPAGTGDGTAGTWQYIDSDQEPLSPKADQFRYMVITDDNCAKLDLNQADETALSKIPELTADQAQAILDYRGVTSGQTATTTPGSTSTSATSANGTTTQTFKSVQDLLLLQNITPDLIYGVTTWQERLSPAERFRADWAQLQQGQQAPTAQQQPPQTSSNGATGALLTDRFVVDSAARRLGSDGQARVTLASVTRTDLETRLQTVAQTLGIDTSADTAGGNAGGNGGGNGRGQRTASPINAALNVLSNRGVRNWSQVWGLVSNNKEAVRLLADVITLPNDGGGGGNVNNTDDQGGGGGGGFGGGGFGGRPGGGGPGRGGGPGGGGPGGGGPGGGPGGGRPGGGPGGGGPGGGFPGGGGPGGGFPGGGGPGGGFPGGGGPGGGGFGGGGGRGASNRMQADFPSLALFRPGRDQYQVQLVQGRGGGGAAGGANPGGGQSGRPGGGGAGGGRPGGSAGGTSRGGAGGGSSTGGTAASASTDDATAATEPMAGAINLNTAAPEILATLPNMTDDVVQAIVTAREQAPFVSRGDILKIDQVTNAIFNGIVEKVTVVSDSYTVRALGMSKNVSLGSGRINDLAVHLTATIDRTTGRCRIVRLRQDN